MEKRIEDLINERIKPLVKRLEDNGFKVLYVNDKGYQVYRNDKAELHYNPDLDKIVYSEKK